MAKIGWEPVSVKPVKFPGNRTKLTLTPHLISPVAVWQALSGAETQSVSVSEEETVLSACSIIMEPQSAIADSAWPAATLDKANAGPLITKSNDSNTTMMGRFFADILLSSTKL
ncbi:hypothetical protein QQM79_10105 [Marinobacteraceae bacterium S3BR75-40.1]